MSSLSHILSPITIKSMTLANRVVMPPMGTNLGNDDGTVSAENLAYLKRRAKGQQGLIITEITAAHPGGIVTPNQLGAYDDRFIPGLKKMVSVAHEAGTKIAMQIHHVGRESIFLLNQGKAVGPSAVPSIVYRRTPREITLEEIQEVITGFGAAADRARQAGFDAVEIHAAHGYLLMQFLSAISNRRTDDYGGATLKDRSRFVIEVIEEVRRRVGPAYPISVRVSAEEHIRGGYTAEDMQTILPDMVRAGADLIHASIGTHGSPGAITQATAEHEPGFNAQLARKMKDVVDVPVIAVGRFNDPAQADEVIARGDADLAAFGRQFLADPDFLIKAKSGRSADIRKCIACNQGCIEREMLGEGNIRCSINPETGQETIYPQGPAAKPKDVWVVGSGPGGLTAAFEAARLGHRVTLFEQEKELGGQIRYARIPPYKAIYGEWIDWQIGQVKKAGITIKNNTEVSESMLKAQRPEHVILATGGEKIVPKITGIDKSHVCDAWQILSKKVAPKNHVLVVGGGLIGMETADFLSEQGSQVTLVEILERSPVRKITSHGFMVHQRLQDRKCRLLFSTALTVIGDGKVEIETKGETSTLSPVDQVVLAVGLKPRDELKEVLEALKIPYVVIGDARQPRRIFEAVEEGARAAWEL
ncbi:MAG: FAD-dependent oxidoreductase [Thermodesulfobacteriota bacterium]|jgi:2,4-dienoyl-CoA reductase-like NADH-dependent reductase (Old Yellow Enzyme family)/thioredoxin reductase